MKKYLNLIFLGIMVAILLPAHINAEVSFSTIETDPTTDATSSPGYKITKYPIKLNVTSGYEGTFTLDITLTPKDSSSTVDFQPNTSAGVTAEKVSGSDNVWRLTITNLSVGEVTLGIYKVTAVDKDGVDCGGDYSFGKPVYPGADTSDDNNSDNTNTGYSIPYIALAVGTIGTVTVIATSKKKNKFYKI